MRTAMSVLAIVMLVLAIIWTVAACFIYGIGEWQISRDTDRVLERAQIAAEAGDMLEYMLKLRNNMQKRGMIKGHTAFVFKTDMNDMGMQFRSVNKVIERLKRIKNLDKTSTAYQTALDDIRGIIREMPRIAGDWFYIKTLWILAIITFGLWLITGIVWLVEADY